VEEIVKKINPGVNMENPLQEGNSKGVKADLQAAISLEEKGHIFYKEAASKAGNPLTKKLFSVLAEQELEHKKRIQEIFEGIKQNAEVGSIESNIMEDSIKEIFKTFSKEVRENWTLDITDAYKHAMEFERESAEMYKNLSENSTEKWESDFFLSLEKEENDHFTAIENVYNYLEHSSDWFESEESKTWNWMNT
jgi:rubrerythrin